MLKKLAAGSIVSALMITLLAACAQSNTAQNGSSASPSSAATTAATATATPAPSAKVDTLVIAYLPNEAKEELAQARQGLAKDLGAALHVTVKEFLGSDYNAVIEAMRTGKADIANFGPLSYSQAQERSKAEPMVVPAADGKTENATYNSYIITQAKNDKINSIADLKGKTFAFVDPNSTSGNLVPSFEILKAINDNNLTFDDLHTNGKFFKSVSFSGAHQNGLQAVAKGDIEAAPVASDTFDREIAAGRVDKNAVKIIFKSPPIPQGPLAIRGDLPADLKKQVKDFLVKYDNDKFFTDFVGQKAGQKIRYVPVEDKLYTDILALRKKFNL
ncbi:phosphate/phosphite/phosphonate ABC transporter substrate-binding protein [Paenibacillus sp. GP183]|uniref:phosphate/phosphite/phosphonate ABC transporter substrate-binding protein n=1 Tax=Paenibacillus sp. GP183 TaxID=1882751 RepID=UPI00089AB72A|nr:phosphate/phosphite/phosphonate ABC transporter substrate-binding protein [Paenibacillus sp. GP183]SEC62085.1 phosphonate transport system substrate-binding protein [Paenibacillus sp. GP183]